MWYCLAVWIDVAPLIPRSLIPFNVDDSTEYVGFTKEEALVYNSEVGLLNSVRQTIVSEVSDVADTDDAEALWEIYSQNLSPATYEIAKAKAKAFIVNFKK